MLDGPDYGFGVRHDNFFESASVVHRDVESGYAGHRGIQVVKRFALDVVHDLRADSGHGPPLLQYHGPVRLLHGRYVGVQVERAEAAQVHDLGLDLVLGSQLLRRLQRNVHHLRVRDDRHVLADPFDVSQADRDEVFIVRHLSLHVVQQLPFDEHDRVFVPNRALEKAQRVGRRGRRAHLETGNVGVPRIRHL